MTSFKQFKNWGLGLELTVILTLVLVILLDSSLVILDSSVGNMTLRTGQQRVEEAAIVSRSRFAEAEQEILIHMYSHTVGNYFYVFELALLR